MSERLCPSRSGPTVLLCGEKRSYRAPFSEGGVNRAMGLRHKSSRLAGIFSEPVLDTMNRQVTSETLLWKTHTGSEMKVVFSNASSLKWLSSKGPGLPQTWASMCLLSLTSSLLSVTQTLLITLAAISVPKGKHSQAMRQL